MSSILNINLLNQTKIILNIPKYNPLLRSFESIDIESFGIFSLLTKVRTNYKVLLTIEKFKSQELVKLDLLGSKI